MLIGKTEPGGDSPKAHSRVAGSETAGPSLRYAPVGMTKWRAVAHLGMGGGGWTELTVPKSMRPIVRTKIQHLLLVQRTL